MQVCHCILGTTSPDSCKNCNNNNERFIYEYTKPFTVTSNIDFTNWLKINTLEDIKSKIENLTIKELKELMEYMKKYEALVK